MYFELINWILVYKKTIEIHPLPEVYNRIFFFFQEALHKAKIPDTVMSVFQEAIDTANKGLINWIFKHRGMKLLSVLSLPYTLPFEIAYAAYSK